MMQMVLSFGGAPAPASPQKGKSTRPKERADGQAIGSCGEFFHHEDTEARREGDLRGVEERLLEAFGACVVMKPETHSGHGNKAMSRIGG